VSVWDACYIPTFRKFRKKIDRLDLSVHTADSLRNEEDINRNISATSSGVFITCPCGSLHDGLSMIRSSFIRSLLSYPRTGQFLVTLRGQFSMARDTVTKEVEHCVAPEGHATCQV
jgi:hypothetical protein